MKNFVFKFLALVGICVSAFAASADIPINSKTWKNPDQNLQVITVCHLTDRDLNAMMQGHCPEIAIEFSAQTVLPISFFLKGDLVNFIESEAKFGWIETKQTFYARCVKEELFLSTNLTDWKPVLEFITGHASIAISIQDGKPTIVVGAETNRRV